MSEDFWNHNTGLPYPFAWTVRVSRGDSANDQASKVWTAQEVTIPGETTMYDNFGPENTGGWLPGYGVIKRESFLSRAIVVNFFDTNTDDPEWDLYRPWAIEVADKGLVDQGVQNGTITCTLFDRAGKERRTITGKNAFPTACEGFTVNYGTQPFTVKSVTFACRNITGFTGDSKALMG